MANFIPTSKQQQTSCFVSFSKQFVFAVFPFHSKVNNNLHHTTNNLRLIQQSYICLKFVFLFFVYLKLRRKLTLFSQATRQTDKQTNNRFDTTNKKRRQWDSFNRSLACLWYFTSNFTSNLHVHLLLLLLMMMLVNKEIGKFKLCVFTSFFSYIFCLSQKMKDKKEFRYFYQGKTWFGK